VAGAYLAACSIYYHLTGNLQLTPTWAARRRLTRVAEVLSRHRENQALTHPGPPTRIRRHNQSSEASLEGFMTRINKVLLGIGFLTIIACGGSSSGANDSQLTRSVPVNFQNSSVTSAQFKLQNANQIVNGQSAVAGTITLRFPDSSSQGDLTGVIANPATGQTLATSNSVTVAATENLQGVDFVWNGTTATLTKH
jgi:hypothetical protein